MAKIMNENTLHSRVPLGSVKLCAEGAPPTLSVPEDPLLYPEEAEVWAGRVEGGKPGEELVHAAAECPEIGLAALRNGRKRQTGRWQAGGRGGGLQRSDLTTAGRASGCRGVVLRLPP